MKKLSTNTYHFQSSLSQDELFETLRQNVLMRNSLVMRITDKRFIGSVNENSFSLISSSFPLPYGAMCTLKGSVSENSAIHLNTSINSAFRILFYIWLGFVAVSLLVGVVFGDFDLETTAFSVVGMSILAILFLAYLHVLYVFARNRAIRDLKEVLVIID